MESSFKKVKLLLILLLWCSFTAGLYIVTADMWEPYIQFVYMGLGSVLVIAYTIYNRGLGRVRVENLEKPEDMSVEEFNSEVEKIKVRSNNAKYFIIAFIPFPFIIGIDYLILLWSGG